jgi:hypothetical protein
MRQHEIEPGVWNELSPPARELLRRSLATGGAYAALVPGGPSPAEAYGELKRLTPETVLAHPPRSPAAESAAAGVVAGLWLWFDFLDESHRLAQNIHTATGSFWHAVMHRREGDFSNSKYWYARCASHPALSVIARRAGDVVRATPVATDEAMLSAILSGGGFDPKRFVDLVESVHTRPDDPAHAFAVEIQRIEWVALFESSVREAR